jgi:hypothetical protein
MNYSILIHILEINCTRVHVSASIKCANKKFCSQEIKAKIEVSASIAKGKTNVIEISKLRPINRT